MKIAQLLSWSEARSFEVNRNMKVQEKSLKIIHCEANTFWVLKIIFEVHIFIEWLDEVQPVNL